MPRGLQLPQTVTTKLTDWTHSFPPTLLYLTLKENNCYTMDFDSIDITNQCSIQGNLHPPHFLSILLTFFSTLPTFFNIIPTFFSTLPNSFNIFPTRLKTFFNVSTMHGMHGSVKL